MGTLRLLFVSLGRYCFFAKLFDLSKGSLENGRSSLVVIKQLSDVLKLIEVLPVNFLKELQIKLLLSIDFILTTLYIIYFLSLTFFKAIIKGLDDSFFFLFLFFYLSFFLLFCIWLIIILVIWNILVVFSCRVIWTVFVLMLDFIFLGFWLRLVFFLDFSISIDNYSWNLLVFLLLLILLQGLWLSTIIYNLSIKHVCMRAHMVARNVRSTGVSA